MEKSIKNYVVNKNNRLFWIIAICIVLTPLFFLASAKFLSVGQDKFQQIDTIIVLGYPSTADGTISSVQQSRVDKGIVLLRHTEASKIVFTGGAAHNTSVEAEIMRDYAIEKGVDENQISIETNSQTTYENAKFTGRLINDKNQNCIVVSSNFHTRRARLIFKEQFPNLQVAGAAYPKEFGVLKLAGAIIHEYLGFCYYYIVQKGT